MDTRMIVYRNIITMRAITSWKSRVGRLKSGLHNFQRACENCPSCSSNTKKLMLTYRICPCIRNNMLIVLDNKAVYFITYPPAISGINVSTLDFPVVLVGDVMLFYIRDTFYWKLCFLRHFHLQTSSKYT